MRMLLPLAIPPPARPSRRHARTLLLGGLAVLVVLGGLGIWGSAPAPAVHSLVVPPPASDPGGLAGPRPRHSLRLLRGLPRRRRVRDRLSGHGPSARPPERRGARLRRRGRVLDPLRRMRGPHLPPRRHLEAAGRHLDQPDVVARGRAAPRSGATFVDDVHDGYLLLFGGEGSAGAMGDACRFSGGAWSPLVAVGDVTPPPRSGAAGVYDSVDGLVLLFGGLDASGTVLGDTWNYAGGTWTQLGGSGFVAPSPRSNAAVAFDPSDAITVLFGGQSASMGPLADTWSFHSGRWSNLSASVGTAPSARYSAAAASDPGRNALVLYGGQNSTILSDSWEFSSHVWTNLGINLSSSPLARAGSSATYDAGLGYIVMFGGLDGASYRDGLWALLSLSPRRWSRLSWRSSWGVGPVPRVGFGRPWPVQRHLVVRRREPVHSRPLDRPHLPDRRGLLRHPHRRGQPRRDHRDLPEPHRGPPAPCRDDRDRTCLHRRGGDRDPHGQRVGRQSPVPVPTGRAPRRTAHPPTPRCSPAPRTCQGRSGTPSR